MSWTYLMLAGLFEIGFALGLKHTDGFTRPVPTILTVVAIGVFVWLELRKRADLRKHGMPLPAMGRELTKPRNAGLRIVAMLSGAALERLTVRSPP